MTRPSTLLFAIGLLAAAGAGCGSNADDNAAVRTASHDSGPALSHAFDTQCALCHGASGGGSGTYPELPGSKTDVDSFIALVRAGKDQMPAFTTSQISDADLRSDFVVLSNR